MGLLQECEELFGTKDLYELLSIPKTADEKAIRKAFRKKSLKVHPDRSCDEDATKKFQVISMVAKILLGKDSRECYDEEGIVDESDELNEENLKTWDDYFRTLFKFDVNDMKAFEESYKNSEEELKDLKENYLSAEGDMDQISESQILFNTFEDETRLRGLLQSAIDKGEIPAFDAFTNEPKAKRDRRKRKRQRESREFAKSQAAANLGESSGNSLEQTILQRQRARKQATDSFFDQLEAKYAKPEKKTKSKRGKRKK